MSVKLSKSDEKLLRVFADDLPVIMNQTREIHIYTGAELIEQSLVDKDEKVDPETLYHYAMPVQIATNHYRQLKKAWIKHGQDGLVAYLKGVQKIVNENAVDHA